jgi:replicative DNA helicase
VTDQLPAAVQTEITVLGAMLLDGNAREDASVLREEDFALDSHQVIYKKLRQMMERNEHIDLTTVYPAFAKKALDAIGGPAYLAYLTEGIPRNPSVSSYVRLIKQKSLARQGAAICNDGMVGFMEDGAEPDLVLTELEERLEALGGNTAPEKSLEEQSAEELEVMEKQRTGEMDVFLSSGLEPLDRTYGGYAIGELTFIAARPNVGKSTLLRQGVVTTCEADDFVHLVSPEMEAGRVLRALWAFVARIPFNKVRHPERMTEREMEMMRLAMKAVSGFPLRIDDDKEMTPNAMIALARRVKRKHNTKLFGLDYLQQLEFPGGPQQRAGELSAVAKKLAKLGKLKMAVVVVSALTEEDGKKNAPPTMHNLRGSGDLKYAGDTIYLLHRQIDADTQKLEPETLLIGGKARSDVTGSMKVYMNGSMQRFEDAATYLGRVGGAY